MNTSQRVRTRLRELVYTSPIGPRFLPRYPYFFSPAQLCEMVHAVDEVREVPGSFLEIGCALGTTTTFLNRHLHHSGLKRDYVCIDTFSGFMSRDVAHEVNERNKGQHAAKFDADFRINSPKTFAATMRLNGFPDVKVVQGDVCELDLEPYGPVAFCLLDVDLYLPIRDSLEKLAPIMSPGGIIVVDDCAADREWDGSLQAYDEFVKATGRERDIRQTKLGFLRF